jgi:hypothetical protein
MATKPVEALDASKIPTQKATDHRVVYADNFRMAMTPWDIQMAVGRVDQVPVADGRIGTTPTIEDLFTLIVSPPQAKALHSILGQAITAYEGQFGTVNIPPQYSVGMRLDADGKAE